MTSITRSGSRVPLKASITVDLSFLHLQHMFARSAGVRLSQACMKAYCSYDQDPSSPPSSAASSSGSPHTCVPPDFMALEAIVSEMVSSRQSPPSTTCPKTPPLTGSSLHNSPERILAVVAACCSASERYTVKEVNTSKSGRASWKLEHRPRRHGNIDPHPVNILFRRRRFVRWG